MSQANEGQREVRLTGREAVGPASGATGIVGRRCPDRIEFCSPLPLFLDSQMLGGRWEGRGRTKEALCRSARQYPTKIMAALDSEACGLC